MLCSKAKSLFEKHVCEKNEPTAERIFSAFNQSGVTKGEGCANVCVYVYVCARALRSQLV